MSFSTLGAIIAYMAISALCNFPGTSLFILPIFANGYTWSHLLFWLYMAKFVVLAT
jgi:hypothetical protein